MEYKQITRQEILNTLVSKFGAVEVARYYLSDALSDIQSLSVGIAENNPMLAARYVESLQEELTTIRTLLDKKENKPSIEKAIKDNITK